MPHPHNPVQSSSVATGKEKSAGEEKSRTGKVFLVGAGPGDPGLLTIRGLACLKKADVVLYDGLANSQLLSYCSHAECVSVGKHGQIPIWTQTDINAKIVELARAGKQVVRLKGGDPAVFARTAEELEVLIAAKIPFEVVPGITAALAAASYVGIPITHRRFASAVALITGQQQTAERPQDIDWNALANFPGTIVFYMGVTTVAQWSARLIEAGKSGATPAAIVRRCTWSDQTVIRCRLDEVTELLTPASKMRPPVIVIIGEVAALGEDFDWFTNKPLHGQGVLVTRAEHQSDSLAAELRELGADVYEQPSFEVVAPVDVGELDGAIGSLRSREVNGITFSSTNGVDGFFTHLRRSGLDARLLAGVQLAAVGPATAERLSHYGLCCDLMPAANASQALSEHGFGAEALIETLASKFGELSGQRWIVTTTNRTRETLARGLTGLGAAVQLCLSYETRPVAKLELDVDAALRAGRIQWATITSGFVAEAVANQLGDLKQNVAPVALSPKVADALKQFDWQARVVAEQTTDASLIEAVLRAAHDSDRSD